MEQFKIYVNRLKPGQIQTLDETVSSAFLSIEEKTLSFPDAVRVEGEIYLADDHFIAHLVIEAAALIPCSICNQPVRLSLSIKDFYFSKPFAEITTGIFDLTDEIRESILIQAPQFAECNAGQCPERKSLQPFLEKKKAEKKASDPSEHFPFADLES